MMRNSILILGIFSAGLTSLCVSTSVEAAGFQISEHSASATGRAGAVFATVSDPSAVFFNPAGLAKTKGTQLSLGVTGILPTAVYVGPGLPSTVPAGTTGDVRQEGVSNWVPLPNFYASRALSDKAYVGMGFYAPYGLGIGWENPEEFVGRTVIQEQSLRTFFITPLAIALQLSDWLAVGVKVSLVPASVHLKKTLGAGDNGQVLFPASRYGSEGTAELAGSAFGVGFGLGAQAEPYKNVKLGLSYRSAVTLDFAGQVDFNLPKSVPTEIQAKFPDGDIRGLITLPHSFAMGLAWETNKLSIEAAANLTLWQSYDELKIEFVSGLPSESTISPRDWEAAMTYRLGAEYQVLEMLSLRAGVIYDETPVPDSTLDPTLPDADRMIGTVGAGMKFGPMSADLAYMAVMLEERSVESSVTFPTKATYPARTINLLALSLGYTF